MSRLVDETETKRSFREFCEQYLDERGRDNITQLAVDERSLREGLLLIKVHAAPSETVPEVVDETDIITIADREYDFKVVDDPYGPSWFKTISIYDGTDSQPEEARFDVAIRTARRAVLELQEQDGQTA